MLSAETEATSKLRPSASRIDHRRVRSVEIVRPGEASVEPVIGAPTTLTGPRSVRTASTSASVCRTVRPRRTTTAPVGVHKALSHGANIEAAILLGTVTAVGGGVLRDVLLNRVPGILAKEIYALAALVAAIIQVVAEVNEWPIAVTPWFAAGVGFIIRFLAMRYAWGLPMVGGR